MSLIQAWCDYCIKTDYFDSGQFRLQHKVGLRNIKTFSKKELIKKNNGISNHLESIFDFSQPAVCPQAELRHKLTLTPGNKYYQKGYVVMVDRMPIGHIKLKGEKTFLAWKTIRKGSKFPIIFGGIYAIPFELHNLLGTSKYRL